MTAYRSTTDEMLAARFDPEPWCDKLTGERRTESLSGADYWRPRLELIPQRYEVVPGDDHVLVLGGHRNRDDAYPVITLYSGPYLREVRRPEPNPVLVALRDDLPGLGWSRAEEYRDFLDALLNSESFIWGMDATPEQIEHAIRVLLRLVALG